MKRGLSMALLCAVAFGLIGCQSFDSVGPDSGLEPISVAVVQYRTVTNQEPMSTVNVSGGLGSVTIQVTRPALCATLVSAAANQLRGEVNIVSRVGNNPAANCGPIPPNAVVDYVGTVRELATGSYRVKVFEAIADGSARFIGSAVVKVTGGEN